ncbi:hypothetical protein VTO42DRAFT_3204 [Malbranchea cinnamomea]
MQAPHHRKIELQSTADLAYLYANTVALSRQKLDLYFPPSANESDPLKERVRELVDEFINKTFTSAIPSISINGLDTSSPSALPTRNNHSSSSKGGSKTKEQQQYFDLQALLSTRESVEYEPYDAALAARVSTLYAQLEALTTTVAQMRRDAPGRAARMYAEALRERMKEDDEEAMRDDGEGEDEKRRDAQGAEGTGQNKEEADVKMSEDSDAGLLQSTLTSPSERDLRSALQRYPEWVLQVPFGSDQERERWREGEMSEIYADALRRLVKLQGDASEDSDDESGNGDGSSSLAATVGKVERARQAAEVVENM